MYVENFEELWNGIICATNEEGYYVAVNGCYFYPIIFNENEMDVFGVSAPNERYPEHYQIRFDRSRSSIKFGYIEPKELLPKADGQGRTENLFKVIQKTGFAILERDGKYYACEMNSSSFGGGWSDGFNDAVYKILEGKGHLINMIDIPEGADGMRGNCFLDDMGNPIGKDTGFVILEGYRNGNGVLRYTCSDKSIERAVPGKKSRLFAEIDGVMNFVTILAKPFFTTKNGITICDPVRILHKN